MRYPNDVRPPYPLSPNLCLTPAHFVIASDDSYSAATSTASTALPPIVLNDGGANNDREEMERTLIQDGPTLVAPLPTPHLF